MFVVALSLLYVCWYETKNYCSIYKFFIFLIKSLLLYDFLFQFILICSSSYIHRVRISLKRIGNQLYHLENSKFLHIRFIFNIHCSIKDCLNLQISNHTKYPLKLKSGYSVQSPEKCLKQKGIEGTFHPICFYFPLILKYLS